MDKDRVPILSTGDPSTLASYLKLCMATFGADSPATVFIEDKIRSSRRGGSEVVLAAESQVVALLVSMVVREKEV